MQQIHWPLFILSRSIHYKNLTGAAPQVGLSQPQLSRLIKQLEKELGIELLDRTSKRNTRWTSEAHRLAEIYSRSMQNLEHAIEALQVLAQPKRVRVGSLEGMASVACETCQRLLELESIMELHIDIFDLNELEGQFLSGELDLMFSSRVPGRKKYLHLKELGYQRIQKVDGEKGFQVLSRYEFSKKSTSSGNKRASKLSAPRSVVSNSLLVRKIWLEAYGGSGMIPGKVTSRPSSQTGGVALMIATDSFNAELWSLITKGL